MAPQFEIHSELAEDTARLTVSGELDVATAPQLKAEADALLERAARHLILDLSGLTFIDSSGLSLFVALSDRAAKEDWTLSLTKPPGRTFSVFRITGTDGYLPFIDEHGRP